VIEFIRNETTLMAYADGELDLSLAAALEEAMKSDPQLVSELVGFIRSRRIAKAAAMSAPGAYSGGIPEILRGEPKPTIARRSRGRHYPALLLAAGIAAAAFFGGTLLDQLRPGGTLQLLESAEMAAALNSKPSGSEAEIGGRTLRLVGTFQSPSTVCREAEVSGRDGRTNAVMCRSAGTWSPALTMTARERGYEPAAGSTIVDGYLASIGAEPVAQGAEMQALEEKL
jgi:hypothetical protein